MANFYDILGTLFGKPSTVAPQEIHTGLTDKQKDELRRMGMSISGLQEIVNKEISVQYDRISLYQECVSASQHPIISGALYLYSSTATVYNRENNATIWCTSESEQYKAAIEKLFERINLEEKIFDWASAICLRGSTKISLLDGSIPTIKEMADNPKDYIGKKIWSVNPKTKSLELDTIVNAFKTKSDADMVRVTLDSGEVIDCTPNHLFMLRDGSFKRADGLVYGQSLMPMYTKLHKGYKVVYNPSEGVWESQAKFTLTKEFLTKTYVQDNLTTSQIGKLVNCNSDTVRDYLMKFNIPLKKGGFKLGHKLCLKFDSILTEEFLLESYVTKGLTTYQIGKMVGTSGSNVSSYLKKFNIQVRLSNWKLLQGKILAPLCKLIYKSSFYKAWREEVFKRDNYTCQECGSVGYKLEAHHKNPFTNIFKEFLQIYSQFSPFDDKHTLVRLAESYEPFWDLENGETLCKKCHKETESYGNKVHTYLNHKVLSVVPLSEKEDVYDLTIEKNHNFPTEAGVFVHNCMYGDLFLDLNAQPGAGVLSIDDSKAPVEFYRIEKEGALLGFFHQHYSTQSSKEASVNLLPPWKLVHLYLASIMKRRPVFGDNYGYRTSIIGVGGNTMQESSHYGSPIIMPALPVLKRLRLAEDSILMGRATRTPLKYLYKVGIPNDGCFFWDTKIKLLDGTTPTIGEMAENKDKYIGRGILTINPETQELVPGKILDAKKTKLNAELVRVHLDNDTHVDCTPDHKFMLRDGKFKEAKDLIEGESLMPLYTKLSDKVLKGYELVYNPADNKWKYTHRLVGKCVNGGKSIKKGRVVHHKNFIKIDNDQSNLEIMNQTDHMKLHQSIGHLRLGHLKGKPLPVEHVNKIAETVRQRALEHKTKIVCACGCGEEFICNLGELRIYKNQDHYLNTKRLEKEIRTCECGCDETFEVLTSSKITFKNIDHAYKSRLLPREIRECKCGCGFKKEVIVTSPWKYRREHVNKNKSNNGIKLNHKVVKVEHLQHRADTYDLTIDGFSNFPLANGVFVHNSNIESIQEIMKSYANILKRARSIDLTSGSQGYNDRLNNLGMSEDILTAVWGDVNNLAVEKLGGDVDIKWLTDVDKLEGQVCTALAIPQPLLGGQAGEGAQGLSPNSSLENMDIRFSRNISRIQRSLLQGIKRLCQIHLSYLNMDPDPKLFELHMNDTSSAGENEKKENLKLGIEVTSSLFDALAKVVGEDRLDRRAVFEVANDNYLKLPDISYDDLLLPEGKANTPVAAEPTVPGAPVGEESTVEGGPTPGAPATEPLNASKISLKKKLVEKKIVTSPNSGDLKAFTIQNESEWKKLYENTKVTITTQKLNG